MGQSARRLVTFLGAWKANVENGDEAFWQEFLTANSYALSQIFSVPVVFIKGNAYVGGMNIDRQDARLVDFLLSTESSCEAVIIEIKTPITKLLGAPYRGVHRPSADLAGAVVQVSDYRSELGSSLHQVLKGTGHAFDGVSPKCILIVGNGGLELDAQDKRKSFELFRGQLKDVEIVTYDELFRKAEILATLFNLVPKASPNTEQ
jgi:Domain of unknown function (DUF4263)